MDSLMTVADDDLLESTDDDSPLEIPAQQRKVITEKLDLAIETLYSRIQKGRVDLQPDFQRNFVWNASKSSRLIESILLNIPITIVYVAEEPNGNWSVVDGQQRLTALKSFIDGKYPDQRDFRLSSLQVLGELNGKTFSELGTELQNAIETTALRLIVIKNDSDPDVRFEVFERLNLGADKLNDQELRNSVYRGSYNTLLRQLAENSHMLKIMGLTTPHNRMTDVQLILRFFAMRHNGHWNYRAPMKQFMNREMEANRNVNDKELKGYRATFENAIELAWTVFGNHAFRRYTPGTDENQPNGRWDSAKLNVALWDTILYGLSYFEKSQIVPIADAVKEEFIDLITTDATFREYIVATTDKPERIRYRAERWRERLDMVVGGQEAQPRVFSTKLKQDLFDQNPTCQICGQRIHDLDDAEVDHILQYWRGGKTIPENARLAHRFCNRSRGGRD